MKPANRPASLAEVVQGGLCTSCGICASIDSRIELRLAPNGHLRPHLPDDADPALVEICPGATVIGPDPAALDEGTRLDPVWGPRRALHRAWATDPQVRHTAAAGGVLTALGMFLLQSGRVDAVLHVRASDQDPVLTVPQISRTPAEVLGGAQSRYGPVAPLVPVRELLDEGIRFAVIAKPCDLTAIRNLGRQDARVDEQIGCLLTIFCGTTASDRMPRAIARAHGANPDAHTTFRYRGMGWPGLTTLEDAAGNRAELTYREAYLDESETRWSYDAPWRCKVCPDQLGEVADLSVPDGWLLDDDGRPLHDEAPGVNVIFERTARGSALVAAAVEAGVIELAALSERDFEQMHADHRGFRLGEPGRLAALREAGAAEPRTQGYRLAQMIELAGDELLAAQRDGTLARIAQGQATEPLV
ncbi:MAG: Coenzyme F420 hydrogenase/dehydrogenase, beta subunit C-terminal domain [Gaiellales bacterium]